MPTHSPDQKPLVQLTRWLILSVEFTAGWGYPLTHQAWLEREAARINADPTRTAEIRYRGIRGMYGALFVDQVAGGVVPPYTYGPADEEDDADDA